MKEKQRTDESKTKDKKDLSDEEAQARSKEELAKVEVKNLVIQMMVSLSSVSYLKLGLPEDANKEFRDIKQAQLAIDSLAALTEAAGPSLSQDEMKAFKSTLANLRMSFVAQSEES